MKQDYNKNLTVTYNFLNLPRTYFLNSDNYSIGYLADGTKIWSYTRMGTSKSTNEYIGPFVYRDGDLDYIITSEVRVVFEDGGLRYYEYHIKDHLGNVRVAFKNNNSMPQVLQTSDYYPFGMRMAERYDDPTLYSKNRYLYNDKELLPDVNLNWYDYGARMYDPQLGRFHSIDLLADSLSFQTPYAYAVNNPVRLIDILGMGPGELFKSPDKAAHDWGKTYNGRSITNNREFGSSIYVVEKNGKTFYTYTEPNKGSENGVSISKPHEGTTIVARIHSHAASTAGYEHNKFSPQDKENYDNNRQDGYIACPDGGLRKYDVESKEITVIAVDLPSDPKDPYKLNDVPIISLEEVRIEYYIPTDYIY